MPQDTPTSTNNTIDAVHNGKNQQRGRAIRQVTETKILQETLQTQVQLIVRMSVPGVERHQCTLRNSAKLKKQFVTIAPRKNT